MKKGHLRCPLSCLQQFRSFVLRQDGYELTVMLLFLGFLFFLTLIVETAN